MSYPPHLLTVTATGDGLTYKLECLGATPACMAYQECGPGDQCDPAALERAADDGDDEPVLHGVKHRLVSFGWGAETGTCWLLDDPDWPEPARELGLTPGVYQVIHVYEDDEFYLLRVLERATPST